MLPDIRVTGHGMVIDDVGGSACNTNAIDLDAKDLAIGGAHHAYANSNSFTVYDDLLTAGAGNNVIVGDVAAQMSIYGTGYGHQDLNQIDLSIKDLASQSGSASNNSFNAFNDTITAEGNGDNTIVGDVAASMNIDDYGRSNAANSVTLAISNYAQSTKIDDANHNHFSAWNDSITAGNGDNTIVGDVLLHSSGACAAVNVAIDNNGNDNTFTAMDNIIHAGSGQNLIIGNVSMDGGYHESLNVNIDDTGSGNTFSVMNDTISGDGTLVGGDWLDNGSININITSNGTVVLGSDLIEAGSGNDLLIGDANNLQDINATLAGGGDFTLFQDTFIGGAGNDTFEPGLGNSTIIGGSGNNTLSYANDPYSVDVNLDQGTATQPDDTLFGGTDTFSNIQNVTGSFAGDDTIIGNSAANVLVGGAGGGNFLEGGLGNDTLTGGGAGNDTFAFDLHNNTLAGGDGHDVITDFKTASDTLNFTDVLGADPGQHDASDATSLNALATSVSSINDDGTNTTISFQNGASIQLSGVTGVAGVTNVASNAGGANNAAVSADLEALVGGNTAHLQIAH